MTNNIDQEFLAIVRGCTIVDEATAEFMELVDCEEWEVKDIPQDRIGVDDPTYIPPERIQAGLGSCEMYFGKHRGKLFRDIPKDYLLWLVRQPKMRGVPKGTQRNIERTKQRVWQYLLECRVFDDR